MTEEDIIRAKEQRFTEVVEAAYNKHKTKFGDYWNRDEGIPEYNAEDFVREVFREYNIQF